MNTNILPVLQERVANIDKSVKPKIESDKNVSSNIISNENQIGIHNFIYTLLEFMSQYPQITSSEQMIGQCGLIETKEEGNIIQPSVNSTSNSLNTGRPSAENFIQEIGKSFQTNCSTPIFLTNETKADSNLDFEKINLLKNPSEQTKNNFDEVVKSVNLNPKGGIPISPMPVFQHDVEKEMNLKNNGERIDNDNQYKRVSNIFDSQTIPKEITEKLPESVKNDIVSVELKQISSGILFEQNLEDGIEFPLNENNLNRVDIDFHKMEDVNIHINLFPSKELLEFHQELPSQITPSKKINEIDLQDVTQFPGQGRVELLNEDKVGELSHTTLEVSLDDKQDQLQAVLTNNHPKIKDNIGNNRYVETSNSKIDIPQKTGLVINKPEHSGVQTNNSQNVTQIKNEKHAETGVTQVHNDVSGKLVNDNASQNGSSSVDAKTKDAIVIPKQNDNESIPHQFSIKPAETVVKDILNNTSNHHTEVSNNFGKLIVEKITKEFAVQIKGNISEMKIVLKPEALGEIAMKLKIQESKLNAQIEVTNQDVRSALIVNLPQLRDELKMQGIEINRIDVFTLGESFSNSSRQGPNLKPKQSTKRRYDEDVIENLPYVKSFGYNTIEMVI